MAKSLSFRVSGWAAWAAERDSASAWRAWAGVSDRAEPPADAAPLPVSLRRRLSPLGQAATRCAWGLPGASSSRLVFASRHGEFGRTLSILDGLVSGDDVSPADFTLSVHHSLAGVLSIAQGNRNGHTSVAAGPDSFGFGLVEAAASLAESPDAPVLLVYYDEPLPPPFATFESGTTCPEAHVLALILVANGGGEAIELTVAPAKKGRPSASSALEFLRFLLTGAVETVSRGERLDWRWSRHAAAA